MDAVHRAVAILFCGAVFLAAGCGQKQVASGDASPAVQEHVTCIGVLPATTVPPAAGAAGAQQAKSLRQGATTMDRLLLEALQGNPKVHFVGQDLMAGLSLSGTESSAAVAKLVGERIGCNAVMETLVSRFNERVGGKYSVEKPASVAFNIQLFSTDSGAVLWSGTFDEAQKSVSENLYEFKKAKSRGFSWVDAEELMREGVRDKLGKNPYLPSGSESMPAQDAQPEK